MKRTFVYTAITICLLISSKIAPAQVNLIYNGDFEIYDTCPNAVSTPGDYQIEHCTGWYSPTYATPDYYNVCADQISGVSIPLNSPGYQNAYNGQAYIGFVAVYLDPDPLIGQWREYVQSQLPEPLEGGRLYYFSFNVSLGECSTLSSSKIGAWFSDWYYTSGDSKPIPFVPQIMNTEGTFLTDTSSWVEISGNFIADGGERYVTIGLFDSETNVDTLRVIIDPYDLNWAYYYIDGVSLVDITDSASITNFYIPNIFSPNSDGNNDFLFLHGKYIEEIEFWIYNRWGELVFGTKDINTGWDGTFRGKDCEPAVYYYYARLAFSGGFEKLAKGNITLVR